MDIAHTHHPLVIPAVRLRPRIPLRRWFGAAIVIAGLAIGVSQLWT